ncbi:glycoside hydrolase superfamily [Delphinella strobiligena]|nr:glycoside hydrolase superfamily [Delphinella strobiligena]
MKTTTVALSALSLAALAIAQPSGHRRHQHLHEKRDAVTVVDVVTNTMPEVVVYVDAEGNVISSSTSGQAAATPPAASTVDSAPAASSAEATSVYVAPASSSVYVAASSSSVYVAPTSSAVISSSKAASSTGSSSKSGPTGYGISYSPYLDNGNCKTQSQVTSDFADISGYGYIRSYGTDCDQVSTILTAAKAKNMKLFLGVYDVTQVSSEIQTIISAIGDDWSYVDTISIGNEGVNDGSYTVDAVVSAIGTARSLLANTGFSGSVVTVDVFTAVIANPALCENSDYAAANCHPFFDGNVEAANSGPWVLEQMQRISSACGGKNTWITETGWPTQGESNNQAIPGETEQAAAISSIKESLSTNVILFNAYNDYWKSNNAGTYEAEHYWGLYGASQFSSQ